MRHPFCIVNFVIYYYYSIIMKKAFFLVSLVFTAILITESCKHTPVDLIDDLPGDPIIDTTGGPTDTLVFSTCDSDTVYFENDIYPIFISNCAISGCHDAETHEEGLNLSTYTKIKTSGILNLTHPWNSELIEVVTENDLDDRMPPWPMAALTDEEIQMLVTWMDQGALNNSCADCDTTAITFSGNILPIMDAYCTGCHDHTSPSGSIDLTAYNGTGSFDGISDVAADGRLVGAVTGAAGYSFMPSGGMPLPDCLIEQIMTWVDEGYPDN